jgi:uncharacterized membrane protein YGL010W
MAKRWAEAFELAETGSAWMVAIVLGLVWVAWIFSLVSVGFGVRLPAILYNHRFTGDEKR